MTCDKSLPVNLLARKTAALSQSVQYNQSSKVVIEKGCLKEEVEYSIKFLLRPSQSQTEIVLSFASTQYKRFLTKSSVSPFGHLSSRKTQSYVYESRENANYYRKLVYLTS